MYKAGKTARSRHFLLRYAPSTRPHSRVTVIVSKKTAKAAARRNRMRRRVYEIIRKDWSRLRHVQDISITVYSAEVQFISHDELAREVIRLLSSAHLYTRAKIDKTE